MSENTNTDKGHTLRETFKNREEIDKFLSDKSVQEVDSGVDNLITFTEGMVEDFPDSSSIDKIFKDKSKSTDDGLTAEEQYDIDDYMERVFLNQQNVTAARVSDTYIMESLNKKILDAIKTYKLTDANQIKLLIEDQRMTQSR